MRDIKFRGLSFDKGFIYGNLIKGEQSAWIRESDYYSFKVKPETIGQYTGLKDKNGKEIYEGDIVTGTKYPFIDDEKQNYIGIVVFYEDVAQFGYEYKCVRKDKKGISNGINNEFAANNNLICEDLEVIGNIYDNPKLLEEDYKKRGKKMKLNKEMIGKYVTRTRPCDLENGNKDYSYIGDKIKILSIDDNHIRYANPHWKSTLDKRWLDDGWKDYEEIIDIDNLDLKELEILQDSLKALVRQDIKTNFKRLNDITKIGLKVDKQIEALK